MAMEKLPECLERWQQQRRHAATAVSLIRYRLVPGLNLIPKTHLHAIPSSTKPPDLHHQVLENMATSRSFTLQDVAKHDSAHDPYMVTRNKVYDCTSFLKKHPGGEEVLLEVAGMDASEAYDEVGHSEDADDILRELYLGDVVALATLSHTYSQFPSRVFITAGVVALIACLLGYLRLRRMSLLDVSSR